MLMPNFLSVMHSDEVVQFCFVCLPSLGGSIGTFKWNELRLYFKSYLKLCVCWITVTTSTHWGLSILWDVHTDHQIPFYGSLHLIWVQIHCHSNHSLPDSPSDTLTFSFTQQAACISLKQITCDSSGFTQYKQTILIDDHNFTNRQEQVECHDSAEGNFVFSACSKNV